MKRKIIVRNLPDCIVLGTVLLLGACTYLDKASDADTLLSETIAEIASAAENGREYSAAAGHFKQLLEREPKNIRAVLGLARNLRYAGAPKEGIKELKRAIQIHGERADLLLELGKSQLAASMINDARESLQKSVAVAPGHWEPHATLAIIDDRVGKHAAAQAGYRKALDLSPNHISVRNNLALSLTLSGQLDEAVNILTKIVNSENATPQTRQNLAVLYSLRGDLEGARRLLAQDLPAATVEKKITAYQKLRGRTPSSDKSPAQ